MVSEFLILMKHELLLLLILFIVVFLKLGSGSERPGPALVFINILLFLNFIAGFVGNASGELFDGMFRNQPGLVMAKNILNLGTLLVSLQASSWLKHHRHMAEFYMLIVATLIGMFFMISSGNLLLFYLGLELSTIPLAALSNFDLEKRRSSEAAMKMIMSSAFASGILLFGASLLYGATGTLSFTALPDAALSGNLVLFAFVALFAGFAFKMSAVPFHLWTADVYEGSPIPVTAYLSVVSKGAILFAFITVLYSVFHSLSHLWYPMLCITAVATMVVGNLFALRQDNMKRFLAFSSIAQVGFILIGVSAGTQDGMASVIYFILIYVFSNLGAFGVITLVSAATGRETLDDYKGFYSSHPVLCWVLTLSLFSLAGIPPTAGFFGKLFLLTSGAVHDNYGLILVAALNMVVSLYYYLRVVKAMFMEKRDQPVEEVRIPALPALALALCVAGILITGFLGNLYDGIRALSFTLNPTAGL